VKEALIIVRGKNLKRVDVAYVLLFDENNEKVLMVKIKGKNHLTIHFQVVK